LIKIALPKGEVLESVADFLAGKGLVFSGYKKDARAYGSSARGKESLFSKQFREKDIPIQVSIGNYDLGLCGSQWLREYMTRYPRADILNLRPLAIPEGEVVVCCSGKESGGEPGEILARMAARGPIRIATEFPALAERFALAGRLPDFRIFPLWGAAEAYPPEGAELALLCVSGKNFIPANNLKVLETLFPAQVNLIANTNLFEQKDLTPVLEKMI